LIALKAVLKNEALNTDGFIYYAWILSDSDSVTLGSVIILSAVI